MSKFTPPGGKKPNPKPVTTPEPIMEEVNPVSDNEELEEDFEED